MEITQPKQSLERFYNKKGGRETARFSWEMTEKSKKCDGSQILVSACDDLDTIDIRGFI